ncbi:hypothetical protein HOL24_01680 [bacterium]|nr:hypothetical protein [bacterium]
MIQNKVQPMIIYLGDLDHIRNGNRITVPYSIACIKVYLQHMFGSSVDVYLFKDPEKLMTI